jgi:starch-binding outer membrane protein, SusD/RagB family
MVEDGSRHFLDDLILYRYADVLLMIAEAKNALGQDPTPELNMVRNRAGLDDYSGPMDQESLDSAIFRNACLNLPTKANAGGTWYDLTKRSTWCLPFRIAPATTVCCCGLFQPKPSL